MKKQIEDGGPAFACDAGNGRCNRGMSLRDWFAGMAINSVLHFHEQGLVKDVADGSLEKHEYDLDGIHELIATDAYALADAMLAARKEQA